MLPSAPIKIFIKILASFPFVDLLTLYFDYKVLNIIKKPTQTECWHSRAERLAVLPQSTAGPPLLFLSLIGITTLFLTAL